MYGPRVTNDLIRRTLHPYPYPYRDSVHVATKVGATRDAQGGWPVARRPDQLRRQVHDNLTALGIDVLDLVDLRLGDAAGPVAGPLTEAFTTLADLQQQGLVRHLGVSNASVEQVAEARSIAPIVCVQNMDNLAVRHDDELVDDLARAGIAYVPFFPSAVSRRCSQQPCPRSPNGSQPRRWPSRWPGCCRGHRTSCSSPARSP